MKKTVSLLISAFLLVTSCTVFALPAAADEAVVYVKDGGTGDGSSASSPLGTFDAALKALAATGGTVKVVDAVTPVGNTEAKAEITGYYYAEPAHEQKITVTSADPANKAQLIFTSECQWYALSGPTVFENLKMVNATEAYARILARGNHITMGEGLEMYSGEALQTALDVFDSTMKGFTLHGITNVGAEYDGMAAADTKITIKSGVYFLVQAYSRKLAEPGVHTGNCYMEFLGDFAVRQMGFASQGNNYTCQGETYVYWASRVHSWRIFPGYDVLTTEPYTSNLFMEANADFLNESDMPQTFVGAAKLKTLNIWYDPASKPATETAEWTKATFTITQADGAVNLDTLDHYTGPAYRITSDPVVSGQPGGTETQPPVTEPAETKAPETKAPETKAPETKAAETKAPDTKAPETKATETTAPGTGTAEAPQQTGKDGVPAYVWAIIAVAAVAVIAGIIVAAKKKGKAE
ncbi:MAG: hypothetical protein II192_02910 [Clostridia bacterium]|nr:hypothetical protein [Clostridia bacterium]